MKCGNPKTFTQAVLGARRDSFFWLLSSLGGWPLSPVSEPPNKLLLPCISNSNKACYCLASPIPGTPATAVQKRSFDTPRYPYYPVWTTYLTVLISVPTENLGAQLVILDSIGDGICCGYGVKSIALYTTMEDSLVLVTPTHLVQANECVNRWDNCNKLTSVVAQLSVSRSGCTS
jgi:hypothetical protein